MCRWGGRDYYFGRDRAAAERAFLDHAGEHPGALVNWMAWRQERAVSTRRRGHRRTIADLVDAFLQGYLDQGRDQTERYYRKHLTRFLRTYGRLYVDELDLAGIAAFRDGLIGVGYAPKTIAHDMGAIKTCWSWGDELGYCQAFNLRARAFRGPPIPAPRPRSLTAEQIKAWLQLARAADPRLESWIALQYLTAMRVSEVPRLIHGAGEFVAVPMSDGIAERGAFVMDRSKTEHRTSFPRYVILSEEALLYLDSAARAPWSWQHYSVLVRAACGPGGPKILRSSAATHLDLLGVDRAIWRRILGHAPNDAGAHYARGALRPLRETAALLTLR